MTEAQEWTDIGVTEVESGTCLLVDPTFHRDALVDAEQGGQAVLDAVGCASQDTVRPALAAPVIEAALASWEHGR